MTPTSRLSGFVWLSARLVVTTGVRKWSLWDTGGTRGQGQAPPGMPRTADLPGLEMISHAVSGALGLT